MQQNFVSRRTRSILPPSRGRSKRIPNSQASQGQVLVEGRPWLHEVLPVLVKSGIRKTPALILAERSKRGHLRAITVQLAEKSKVWEHLSQIKKPELLQGFLLVHLIKEPGSISPLVDAHETSLQTSLLEVSSDSDSDSDSSDSDDYENDSEPSTAFYGVIVQSNSRYLSKLEQLHTDDSWPDGCYVLKVCRSSGASCHSLYYSFTKVSRCQPLNSQLWDAWLV